MRLTAVNIIDPGRLSELHLEPSALDAVPPSVNRLSLAHTSLFVRLEERHQRELGRLEGREAGLLGLFFPGRSSYLGAEKNAMRGEIRGGGRERGGLG